MAILLTGLEKRVCELLVPVEDQPRDCGQLGFALLPQLSDAWRIFYENWLRAILQARATLAPATSRSQNPGSIGSELSLKVFAICAEFGLRENFQPFR